MRSLFLAHAPADGDFARSLAAYLESGCDALCQLDRGAIADGEDLIDRAGVGLSADVLVLLLSPASCPTLWPRRRWEPVLSEEARRLQVEVVSVLLGECPFPGLLRRRNFFDAGSDPRTALRLLKRWVWQRERAPGEPETAISADLGELYAALSDRAGYATAEPAAACRFAEESRQEFAAVLWIPCHGRSLAECAGELGAQLGLRLEGPAKENAGRIRDFLAGRRCLLVLDAPSAEVRSALTPSGRTSTLVTTGPVRIVETPATVACARALAADGRYAEAYELFYRLMEDWVDIDTCAHELTWICERWDRVEEANALRLRSSGPPAEQLKLFVT